MLAAVQKYGPKDFALDSIAQAGFSSVMNIQAALDGVKTLDTKSILAAFKDGKSAPELPRARVHVRRQAARRQHGDLQRLPEDQAGQGRQGHDGRQRLGHAARDLYTPPCGHGDVSSYILFLLLGLGSGAVYGMLALGLVLKHRSAGVVDFGHGAVAMFIAYVYLGLREDGTLQFPWVCSRTRSRWAAPLATVPAIVVSLVYAAVLGAASCTG